MSVSNGIQLENITYNNSILPDIVDTQEICELDTKELQEKKTLEQKPQTKRVKFAQNPLSTYHPLITFAVKQKTIPSTFGRYGSITRSTKYI